MPWYLYWIIFLVIAGMGYYGLFFWLPARKDAATEVQEEVMKPVVVEEDTKFCPECGKEMAKDSLNGIVLDRCLMHGIWFDNGELESVLKFIKSGGDIDGIIDSLAVQSS